MYALRAALSGKTRDRSAYPILVAVLEEVNVAQRSARTRVSGGVFMASVLALPAHAAETPCPSGNTALSCRLHGVLSLLSATAAVLATLLVFVLLAVVWYYRRNRKKDLLPR